jgi:hypothetical protein
MKLKRGNKIFLSERGHKGFFYPTTIPLSLWSDIEAKVLSWAGGGDKIAVIIPKDTRAYDCLKTVQVNGHVWINRSDIIKS